MEKAFVKHKDEDGNNKELAAVIDKRRGAFVFFAIGDDDKFRDYGTAETGLLSWCTEDIGSSEIPEKFASDLNKDLICAFTKI
ncbi:hypothetical protein A6V39_05280 [Candidatus Mycoplasma haematobovis]|uniref:Uncharacterized protein n=1 Tax=Candidatus Mycoplasma haematobovis TaxID=432608 RepID=A0A1A9QBB2_9MOLU|nr:hypothetical protein [Candidatus Mycoplasma haematobovis]OAL09747.1 hypothetical protein A6V39_05280 [Candidatus Mycoplasma haematobovis]